MDPLNVSGHALGSGGHGPVDPGGNFGFPASRHVFAEVGGYFYHQIQIAPAQLFLHILGVLNRRFLNEVTGPGQIVCVFQAGGALVMVQ